QGASGHGAAVLADLFRARPADADGRVRSRRRTSVTGLDRWIDLAAVGAVDGAADQTGFTGAGPLPARTRGQKRAAVHVDEIPLDARGCGKRRTALGTKCR